MITFELLLLAAAALIVADLVILLLIFITKSRSKNDYARSLEFRDRISAYYNSVGSDKPSVKQVRPARKFIVKYCQSYDAVRIDDEVHRQVQKLLADSGCLSSFRRMLTGHSASGRMEAARVLRIFPEADGAEYLRKAFVKEKKYYVKAAMLFGLVSSGADNILTEVLDALESAPVWFVRKSLSLVEPVCSRWRQWAEEFNGDSVPAICLQLTVAKIVSSERLKNICIGYLKTSTGTVLDFAIDAMNENFPSGFIEEKLYLSENLEVRKAAMNIYGETSDEFNAGQMAEFFNAEGLFDTAVSVLQKIISRYPEKLNEVYEEFLSVTDDRTASGYAAVLSERIKYYLVRLDDKNSAELETLCELLVKNNRSSLLIDFFNENRNRTIENSFYPLFSRLTERYPDFENDAVLYLNPELKKRWKILKKETLYSREKIPLRKRDMFYLVMLAAAGLVIYPLCFFAVNRASFSSIFTVEMLKEYVFNYNYYFAFYSATLNTIYALLLLLAIFNIFKQSRNWSAEDYNYLFTPGVLPSMSIIAPAYNEEKNIVESVMSLMNIKYPEYEVIVVNDGSSDQTVRMLVDFYELKKVDELKADSLKTAPVRGVYKNPEYPSLTLIDKENGGKADALNAGINFAGCEFICSIDSDSLLEPESLLKIMLPHTMSDVEIIAVGGNIIPVNGCTVEHGYLSTINLPENKYAQFQTIEYLRSFLAGRMGWAATNNLLIISGAFGVFSRKRVIEIGGYMTGKGRFRKETVGEDMEMVVRLRRHMSMIKEPYRVEFSYNANCWTEVPEDLRSLMKQRDRWHRGLIEIMAYYRDMFANPRYGKTGMVAFVYFYLFELIGPFLETGGYIFIVLSAILGILNLQVAALLFVSVILYGVFISLFSLVLSEKNVLFFSGKEILILAARAVSENLGYRQLLSFSRVFFYISFLFNKNKGWQKLNRKGFTNKK